MEKLTKAQEGALELLSDGRDRSYSSLAQVGASGRTIDALMKRGFISESKTAIGRLWSINEAGRAALAKEQT